MKIIKNILAIGLTILIILGLNFISFATEIEDIVTDNPDISTENKNQEIDEETNIEDNDKEDTNIKTENNKNEEENINKDNTEKENNTDSKNEDKEENANKENTDKENNKENGNKENANKENTDKEKEDSNKEKDDKTNDKNDDDEELNQTEQEDEPPIDTPIENQKPTNDDVTDNIEVEKFESENANLRFLKLDIDGLSPEFDKNITEYYLIVDLSIDSVNIEAYPEDINSIVMIDGNTELQEGENTISITVKAEAGNIKTYTLNVTKTDNIDLVNANLKELSVKGFNFYPSFKNNIYNYNLTINEKISQLEILVEPEIEGATYEIIGNENLVEGDNLIKIKVTAKDGEAKREYKLNVYISSKNVELQKVNKTPAIVLLSFLSIAIICTTIAISKKH